MTHELRSPNDLGRGIDIFILYTSSLKSRIRRNDISYNDIEEAWTGWARIMKWCKIAGKPHNYSRGVLAAKQLRQVMDAAGIED